VVILHVQDESILIRKLLLQRGELTGMLSLERINILSLQHYLVVLALHFGNQACLQLLDKLVVLLFGVRVTPDLEIW
jgi:hypothetical protein